MHVSYLISAILAISAVTTLSCTFRSVEGSSLPARIITVAQSGKADVVGTDSAALEKAAAMLHPGDTLEIGPGTY